VSKSVPEAWSRRGAETDVVYIARLYGAMRPDVRRKFVADEAFNPVLPVVVIAAGVSDVDVAAHEIVRLLERYVGSSDRGAILKAAAQWVALQRISTETQIQVDADIAYEWLTGISKDTFPWGGNVSALLDHVTSTDSNWPSFFFIDGWLDSVLCTSDGEYRTAEGMYAGYEYMRSTVLQGYEIPEPSQFLQVKVDKQDFSDFDSESGWSLDQEAYDLEVQHQCVLKFTSLVGWWRSRFFERLLSEDAAKVHSGVPVSYERSQ
jgi:hypothetical protein